MEFDDVVELLSPGPVLVPLSSCLLLAKLISLSQLLMRFDIRDGCEIWELVDESRSGTAKKELKQFRSVIDRTP